MFSFILIRANCLYYQGTRATLNQALEAIEFQARNTTVGGRPAFVKAFISGMEEKNGSWRLREVDLETFKIIE